MNRCRECLINHSLSSPLGHGTHPVHYFALGLYVYPSTASNYDVSAQTKSSPVLIMFPYSRTCLALLFYAN
ncbi:hypothetical protein LSH36_681g00025 [Paralvinella palmiformis]|uniref:Uncharacterized protein n=1 Tax=Paralvinella palmiformis TaxID=53620 RepID=A0AAD9J2N8_9ANNE|nr:hypothetical protein LSH36_681g00025 [Paralvinella palmiformis]